MAETSRKHYTIVKDIAPWDPGKECLDIPKHLVLTAARRETLKAIFMPQGAALVLTPVGLRQDPNVDVSQIQLADGCGDNLNMKARADEAAFASGQSLRSHHHFIWKCSLQVSCDIFGVFACKVSQISVVHKVAKIF